MRKMMNTPTSTRPYGKVKTSALRGLTPRGALARRLPHHRLHGHPHALRRALRAEPPPAQRRPVLRQHPLRPALRLTDLLQLQIERSPGGVPILHELDKIFRVPELRLRHVAAVVPFRVDELVGGLDLLLGGRGEAHPGGVGVVVRGAPGGAGEAPADTLLHGVPGAVGGELAEVAGGEEELHGLLVDLVDDHEPAHFAVLGLGLLLGAADGVVAVRPGNLLPNISPIQELDPVTNLRAHPLIKPPVVEIVSQPHQRRGDSHVVQGGPGPVPEEVLNVQGRGDVILVQPEGGEGSVVPGEVAFDAQLAAHVHPAILGLGLSLGLALGDRLPRTLPSLLRLHRSRLARLRRLLDRLRRLEGPGGRPRGDLHHARPLVRHPHELGRRGGLIHRFVHGFAGGLLIIILRINHPQAQRQHGPLLFSHRLPRQHIRTPRHLRHGVLVAHQRRHRVQPLVQEGARRLGPAEGLADGVPDGAGHSPAGGRGGLHPEVPGFHHALAVAHPSGNLGALVGDRIHQLLVKVITASQLPPAEDPQRLLVGQAPVVVLPQVVQLHQGGVQGEAAVLRGSLHQHVHHAGLDSPRGQANLLHLLHQLVQSLRLVPQHGSQLLQILKRVVKRVRGLGRTHEPIDELALHLGHLRGVLQVQGGVLLAELPGGHLALDDPEVVQIPVVADGADALLQGAGDLLTLGDLGLVHMLRRVGSQDVHRRPRPLTVPGTAHRLVHLHDPVRGEVAHAPVRRPEPIPPEVLVRPGALVLGVDENLEVQRRDFQRLRGPCSGADGAPLHVQVLIVRLVRRIDGGIELGDRRAKHRHSIMLLPDVPPLGHGPPDGDRGAQGGDHHPALRLRSHLRPGRGRRLDWVRQSLGRRKGG
mmetsp:Transcript_91455/g.244887  ORF Transcript_91455/g.244887 Transcript_91455/m.244887 type:complete len:870 (+) Transcript_91455:442-3051(+)